jgi:glycosyltransferase involved in cell wall biosynthesis
LKRYFCRMKYSLVIPVYNRPQEVDELLASLTKQIMKNFEVIIVEDGSEIKCENVIEKYKSLLTISYFYKPNSGPGMSRNYGAERSNCDYIIFLDSDCIIPEQYIDEVSNALEKNYSDAFGGPDKADESFTNFQKAINYSMTSFLTTGGIRGGKKSLDKFYPRSFNMGYSKDVYRKTGGFASMRFGEDIDMSLRILENGFTTMLIEKAFVYHKRRTNFKSFYKQVFNSGIARINLYKRHPKSLKPVHVLPSVFTICILLLTVFSVANNLLLIPIFIFIAALFTDSAIRNKNVLVGVLAIPASFIQLVGYGSGFLVACWKRLVLRQDEFGMFVKNFYK